jgi:hypothetical protein
MEPQGRGSSLDIPSLLYDFTGFFLLIEDAIERIGGQVVKILPRGR